IVVPIGGTTTPVACNGGAAAGDCRLRPHCVQKVALSALENPHCGHTAMLFSNREETPNRHSVGMICTKLLSGATCVNALGWFPSICGLLKLLIRCPQWTRPRLPFNPVRTVARKCRQGCGSVLVAAARCKSSPALRAEWECFQKTWPGRSHISPSFPRS